MEDQEPQISEVLKMLGFRPVKSSQIAAVAFLNEAGEDLVHVADVKTGILHVQFHNGGRWAYSGVTLKMFEGLMAAPSVGKFFSAFIKGNKLLKAWKVEVGDRGAPVPDTKGA